jgi:hypothetical protein
MDAQGLVPEGQYTSTVYGHIKERQYEQAVVILLFELQVANCTALAGKDTSLTENTR